MKFKLVSDYRPTGDQPQAIEKLTENYRENNPYQVLLGVTGSGKTFTIANLIKNIKKPALIISHNKTLAAQLYQEFKEFFPQSAVSYFVSYYDYYQPEAYVSQTDTYIAKETNINEEIDKLRLRATSSIMSREDVIVVASVSCIYGIGSPSQYQKRVLPIKKGGKISRRTFLESLVSLYYQRSRMELERGFFRVRGDLIEIYPSYGDEVIQVGWENEVINKVIKRDAFDSKRKHLDEYYLYPAKHYLADPDIFPKAFSQIKKDLKQRLAQLKKEGKLLEANRLEQRVNYDLEMIKETGYVNGIENYSRYFDGRRPGQPAYTLLDYFWHRFGDDFLVIIDESHITIPQIRGMYRGDLARKKTLIDFGFRLPASLDNRPLKFKEFLVRSPGIIFVSATPAEWEVKKSAGLVVEQLIRPTGLVDPVVEIRKTEGQIEDLVKEILKRKKKGERVLVTALTKRMAEDLASFLSEPKNTAGEAVLVTHLHADIKTLERSDILTGLRKGDYDVLVGINLLREGLDLPEVSLVVILDADKQGFLRSRSSLIQTMGRAARNVAGKVILYADKTSLAMKEAVREVERRRSIQLAYNKKHNIIPRTIQKAVRERIITKKVKKPAEEVDLDALTPGEAKKLVFRLKKRMRQAARDLDFEKAIELRNLVSKIEN